MKLLLALAAGALAQGPVPGKPVVYQPAAREAYSVVAYDRWDGLRERLAKRGEWYSLPSAAQPVLLLVEKGYLDEAALTRFAKDVVEAVAGVPECTGRKPPKFAGRLVIYVYDGGPASETDVPGVAKGDMGIMLRFVKEDEAPVFHELTHALAGYSHASPSLSEGLAEEVESHFRPGKAHSFTPADADPDRLAKTALGRESAAFLATVGAPNDGKPFESPQAKHDYYFSSWSFVRFLAARKGLGAVFKVMDAGGDDKSYRDAFGGDAASLRADWKKKLDALKP